MHQQDSDSLIRYLSEEKKTIDISLTPFGEICVGRSQYLELNDATLEILESIGIDISGLQQFFNSQKEIEHILGDEPLCG